LTPCIYIGSIFPNDLSWGIADHEVTAIAGLNEHQRIFVSLGIGSDENGRRIEPCGKPIRFFDPDEAG
jgi:hypothetical protein